MSYLTHTLIVPAQLPVGIDLTKPGRNHRSKLRRNLFRLSRENTEQNTPLYQPRIKQPLAFSIIASRTVLKLILGGVGGSQWEDDLCARSEPSEPPFPCSWNVPSAHHSHGGAISRFLTISRTQPLERVRC